MHRINREKAIFLIDGSSFLYRAFYALKPMTSPDGAQIGAVFGFCRMLKKLLDTFDPKYCALVWDSKGKTERHKLYTEYKATRDAAPMHLFEQKALIQEFATAIKLAQIEKTGFEADDLLASLARHFAGKHNEVVIVTSDKDLGQVVTPEIVLYDSFKQEIITKDALETKYGFPLSKLPFYFALCGDASDNIPGVRGIGPKGATELVKQFDSLEDLYEHLDQVPKERTRLLLQESRENAFLSLQLFLPIDVPTRISLEELACHEDNWRFARAFFERHAFVSLLKELGGPQIEKKPYKPAGDYVLVNDKTVLHHLVQRIRAAGAFACDTETDGNKVLSCKLVGISCAYKEGVAYYIPFDHVHKGELTQEEVLAEFKPLFEDASIKKYFHHAKFDIHALARAGIRLQGLAFDTLIAASLLRRDSSERIGLKALSESLLDEPMLSFEDVVTKNGHKNFSHVPLALATEYAAADAHQTFKLVNLFAPELHKEKMDVLFYEIEVPLVPVLCAMEARGIVCDTQVLDALEVQTDRDILAVHTQILDLIGPEFKDINLNSHTQLKALLFEHLQLPTAKKTQARTSYSTDQEVLEELARVHPVPALIIKYRELAKLKSNYIDGLRQWIDPKTSKIHTTFNQTIVATGRLSSSDPNMQNIPTLSDDGKIHVREAFKPEPGHIFVSADYSQIELRVVAYLSQDPVLLHAFTNNVDIHTHTAARIFETMEEWVTREQRQIGKRINFSILYGLTPYGLSKDLNIPYAQAKLAIDKYFEQHAGVSKWMDKLAAEAKRTGYAQTLWGRRRYVPGINERNKALYEAARRVVVNTPAQGTQAELIKIAMIKLDEAFKQEIPQAQMVLQIHDELLVTCPIELKEQVKALMVRVMRDVVSWNVPLEVQVSEGMTWAEASK